jgi:hypothetical protein
MMSSVSLYNTFGNEVKYQVTKDTLVAYLENATVKFPLPEASSEILANLLNKSAATINPMELDQVQQRLIKSGFGAANAAALAQVLLQVAAAQGVSPMSYFSVNDASIKLTIDTYQAINALRPTGNRINLVLPKRNSASVYKEFIQP